MHLHLKTLLFLIFIFCITKNVNGSAFSYLKIAEDSPRVKSETDTFFNTFFKNKKSRKGQVFLDLAMPWLNNFHFQPDHESYKKNTGFFGLSTGLDFYYRKNQFLNFSAVGVIDNLAPVPMGIDYEGEFDHYSSIYLALSNNHKIGIFNIGYGLSFSHNQWIYKHHNMADTIKPKRPEVLRGSNALGFVFPLNIEISEFFYTGIVYRPSYIRFSELNPHAYEHVISWTFGIRIPLNKYNRYGVANFDDLFKL